MIWASLFQSDLVEQSTRQYMNHSATGHDAGGARESRGANEPGCQLVMGDLIGWKNMNNAICMANRME